MNKLKFALLATCLAYPAFAQEIPKADPVAADAHAVADGQNGVAQAQARAAAAQQAQARATLAASGTAGAQANVYSPAQNGQKIDPNSVPRSMPPAIQPAPEKPMTPKQAVGVAVARRWISKYQRPRLDGDGVEHFVSGKGQVFIVTAVDHLTDIALAPGEAILPPLHIGDSASWKLHPASSRKDGKTIPHILIKPTDAGLSTNLVIETNMRTISVELASRQYDHMPLVSLDPPDDGDDDADMTAYANKLAGGSADAKPAAPASPCDQSPVMPPSAFTIDGSKSIPWRPTQVYEVATPVGLKTCIGFQSDIESTGLPALLALADHGGWFTDASKTLVNVRYINRRFIVDQALSHFVLIDDVGGDQKKIEITKKGL
jgi:type IV secretion system protein TrbG